MRTTGKKTENTKLYRLEDDLSAMHKPTSAISKLAGVIALTSLTLFGAKISTKETIQENLAKGTSAATLPELPRQKLSSLKWQKVQIVDAADSKAQQKSIQASEIDGSYAELQVAGSLITLKNHAANLGHEIRYLGQELLSGNYYVNLTATNPEGNNWLIQNSPSYGFSQTRDSEGKIIPGCLHSPKLINNETALSAQVKDNKDFESQMINFAANQQTFFYELNSSGSTYSANYGLPLGVVPVAVVDANTKGLKNLHFKVDSDRARQVTEVLAGCDSNTYQVVKLQSSIFTTLKNNFPELKPGSEEFQKLLKASVSLNSILFGFTPKKIPSDAYICLPAKLQHETETPKKENSVQPQKQENAPTTNFYAQQGEWDWKTNGNPAISALVISASKNHPAKGGGNCGAGSCGLLEIAPISVLDKVTDRNAKDSNGKAYYPGGARHAVKIDKHLYELSQNPNSGIIAININHPSDAPPGAIICYPSNAGRFVLGTGKGSDKYGHIEIVGVDGGVTYYIYDLRTTKPAAGKDSNLIRARDLATKGQFVCYICTNSFLPSREDSLKIAKSYKINGRESVEVVSQVFESGDKDINAISRIPNDPGGASYGKFQFSSRKGSLAEFVKYCRSDPKYKEIGEIMANAGGLKGEKLPLSFDNTWTSLANSNPELFEEAQNKFAQTHFTDRAIERAKLFGIDVRSMGMRAFLNSLAVQFGVPGQGTEIDTNEIKFDEICSKIASSTPKGCDQEMLLSISMATRSGILWRMGNHAISKGNLELGRLYHSIVNNRYREEAGVCLYLNEYGKITQKQTVTLGSL